MTEGKCGQMSSSHRRSLGLVAALAALSAITACGKDEGSNAESKPDAQAGIGTRQHAPVGTAAQTRQGPVAPAGSCAATVWYGGHQYFGANSDEPLERDQKIGTGRVPRCDDLADADPGYKVSIWSVEGHSPSKMVMISHRRSPYIWHSGVRR